MKLALMLGGMAAGRRAGGPGALLEQATKLLGQSPEVSRLGDELRGRLLDAGKAAAVAVAARQVEALTDRLSQRVGSLADLAATAPDESRDSSNGSEPDSYEPAQEETPDEEPSDVDEETPAEKTPRPRARAGAGSASTATRKRSTQTATKTARPGTGRRGGRPARAERSSDDD